MDHSPAAKRQIAFINAAHTATHYCLLILATAVLGMLQQDHQLFGSEYGPIMALGTAMFVIYGVGALPMGWLAAKFGRQRMMLVFFLGTGFFMAVAGFTASPFWLAAALAAMGAFAAIYHPIGTAMLVEAAGEKVGRAVGLNGVFGNLGVATAPVVTAFLAQSLGGAGPSLCPASSACWLAWPMRGRSRWT
jgi:MFS family permease